jgi:hypothetical protein
MRQASSRALFDYWNGLRGARCAPERSLIDPAAIREIMPDAFILEVDLAGGFPVRMSGTRVDALVGAPQNGRRFLDLWPKGDGHAIAAMLLTVSDGACPIVAGAAAQATDYAPIDVEMMFLPLRNDGKTHARIIGVMSPIARPRWFGLVPVSEFKINSFRVIDADAFSRDLGVPQSENARQHRHLRVFEGGLTA